MQDADVLCANRKFELIPVNSISDRITACIIFSGLHFIVVCELHVYLMKIICLFVVLCPYLSYHACSDILSSWDTCNLYRLIVPYIFFILYLCYYNITLYTHIYRDILKKIVCVKLLIIMLYYIFIILFYGSVENTFFCVFFNMIYIVSN